MWPVAPSLQPCHPIDTLRCQIIDDATPKQHHRHKQETMFCFVGTTVAINPSAALMLIAWWLHAIARAVGYFRHQKSCGAISAKDAQL